MNFSITMASFWIGAFTLLRAADASTGKGEWNVRDYGATGRGTVKDTAAIQSALDGASQAGGGLVRIPPGRYLSGTIYLKDNTTLHLDKGATLVGSNVFADYPENPAPIPAKQLEFGRHAFVCAVNAHSVTVEGEGVIDGQGRDDAFNMMKNRAKGMAPFDATNLRPMLLAFIDCTDVRVQGLTLRDSAYWVEDYFDCDNVSIEGLTVRSEERFVNNDGIDIDGCRNVRVANCDIKSGDDGICLKAAHRDCERVAVTNCLISSSESAIKCGTASIGGFKDIAISNCVIYDTALDGLDLLVSDGGTMENVVVNGLTMRHLGAPFFIRLGDRKKTWIDEPSPPPVGQIRNIIISNLTAVDCGHNRSSDRLKGCAPIGASIMGLPGHPIQGVTLSDIRVTYLGGGTEQQAQIKSTDIPFLEKGYPDHDMYGDLPAYGLYCRDAEDVILRDVVFSTQQPDARSAVVADDVKDMRLDGVSDQGKPHTQLPAR